MAHRSATAESSALTGICTGAALALVGINIYWARTKDQLGGTYLMHLSDLSPVAAPVATLWLLFTAGLALTSRGSSPWSGRLRAGVMIFAPTSAVVMFNIGFLAGRGGSVIGHSAITGGAALVKAQGITPEIGCLLYIVGLGLIAFGSGIAEFSARGEPVLPAVGKRRMFSRVAVIAALLLGIMAVMLPWSRANVDIVIPASLDNTAIPDYIGIHHWLIAYRIGLPVGLAIAALALVLRHQAAVLRLLGLVFSTAFSVLLAEGYATWWVLPTHNNQAAPFGVGYHCAIAAMVLLAASFLALPTEPALSVEEAGESAGAEAGVAHG